MERDKDKGRPECLDMRTAKLLEPLLTRERTMRLGTVASMRTRWITIVLDDLYHPHNLSAIIRSAEAFGIQDIHVIQVTNFFKPSPGISLGAQQWINIIRHGSIEDCVSHLRDKEYLILGADPPHDGRADDEGALAIEDLPLNNKVALAFGRERDGLHSELRDSCDRLFHIPMVGFTDSFNVSVSVGICLYELRKRLGKLEPEIWTMSRAEQMDLIDDWAVKSVRNGQRVLDEIKARLSGSNGTGRKRSKSAGSLHPSSQIMHFKGLSK